MRSPNDAIPSSPPPVTRGPPPHNHNDGHDQDGQHDKPTDEQPNQRQPSMNRVPGAPAGSIPPRPFGSVPLSAQVKILGMVFRV